MDCGSARTIAGIDPKVINNWHPESAFSVNLWKQSGYNLPSDWDVGQDPGQSDLDLTDLAAFHEPINHGGALFADSDDLNNVNNSQVTSPKFTLPDGTVEGTISSAVSPKTLSSSIDDNAHPDELWSQFQLFSSAAPEMPNDASLFNTYATEPGSSVGPTVVDDPGDIDSGHWLSDAPPGRFLCSQNMTTPQAFSLTPEPLPDATLSAATEGAPHVEGSNPLLSDPQLKLSQARRFPGQNPLRAVDLHGPNGLPPSTTSTAPILQIAQDIASQNDNPIGQDGLQYKSESPPGSSDLQGVYEFPYSATGDSVPALVERFLDGDNAQYGKWNGSSDEDAPSEVSQPFSSTTAFMASEELPGSSVSSHPSMPKGSSSASQRPSSRPRLALQSVGTVTKRNPRNTGTSEKNRSKTLQIVQEDGQGGAVAPSDFVSPPRGARRKGPLTTVARANAGLRRKNKDTCVQCRLNKRKCDGNSPCDACRPTLHEQPCARACFASIVEYGTCNYISQRAINHPTMDGSGRVRMDIPFEFDLNDLLSFLSERQGKFNIRASQSWGSLYVLDLGETYRFLRSLSEYNGNSKSSFLEFIDRRLVDSKDRSKNWLSCVKECDPMNNVYALLSQWNTMPSRASYSFIFENQECPMDINNPEDRREILLAAQLSRIFCRMLEVEGFRKLERDFYNIKWKQISQGTHLRFLKELGQIMLSLRWRVSWWKCLGDGGRQPDPSQQHYVDRVDLLCKILYVYYTSVLAKLPSWTTMDIPKGVWSRYADSKNAIWDDLPMDATDGGFQRWMARGRELIAQAGVHNPGKQL